MVAAVGAGAHVVGALGEAAELTGRPARRDDLFRVPGERARPRPGEEETHVDGGVVLVVLALVVLGPAVQPWYLLWCLPLLAATALTKIETKWMIYGTVGLTLFSLVSHLCDGAGYL